MLNKLFWPLLLLFIFGASFVSSKDVPLKFISSASQQTYNVEKGSSVMIHITATNQDSVNMVCTISSSAGSSSINLQSGYQQTISFRYDAPTKIKNLQSSSLSFTTNCVGPAPYACGFLWTDTCYYTSSPIIQSITLNYVLSPADQQNLAILENYQKRLASPITSTDVNLKTAQSLLAKTATLLKTPALDQSYANEQTSFNSINEKYSQVVFLLSEELYSSVSNYNSPDSDLNALSTIDSSISQLINEINQNVQKYNELKNNFNSKLDEIKITMKQFENKANTDLLDQFNELSNSLSNKFTNYQFDSFDAISASLTEYEQQYQALISQLNTRQASILDTGQKILDTELKRVCSKGLCTTKNLLTSATFVSVADVCSYSQKLISEVNTFNVHIFSIYESELTSLSYNPNSLTKESQLAILQSLVASLNINATGLNNQLQDIIRPVNKLGEELDLNSIGALIKQYNSANLAGKNVLILNIISEKENLLQKKETITQDETGFFVFFKKLFYTLFGPKQQLETIQPYDLELPISLSSEFIGFSSTSCSAYNLNLLETEPTIINVDSQHSNILTDIAPSPNSCIDENGQRTTNCCNDDSYKNREDLYPVIFVHGHASEVGQKTIQSSLNTFTSMSSYFSQNGYIQKDTLYPEKAVELTKGIWGYCKPVAVRITYYEGISTGGSVQYKSSIGDYAPTLSKDIDAVLIATNKNKAIIASHSMGGILSRYYIKNYGGVSKITKLITISSPHYGITDSKASISWLGKLESSEMVPNSPFLNSLNSPMDSLVDSYAIAGHSTDCSGIGLSNVDCDGVININQAKLLSGKDFIVFIGPQYEHNAIVLQSDVAQKVLSLVKN